MARKSKRSSMKNNRKSLRNVLVNKSIRVPKVSNKNVNPLWLTEQYRQGRITEKEFMSKCKDNKGLEFRNNELICNTINENTNKRPLPKNENQFTFQNPTPEEFIQYLITPEKLFDGMVESMKLIREINRNDRKIKSIELEYQILKLQSDIHFSKNENEKDKYSNIIIEMMPALLYMSDDDRRNMTENINQNMLYMNNGKMMMEQGKFLVEMDRLNVEKQVLNQRNYELYEELINTVSRETNLESNIIRGGSIQFSPIETAQQLVDLYAKIIENKIKRKNQRREILGLANTTVDKIMMALEENYNFSRLKGDKQNISIGEGRTSQQLSSLLNVSPLIGGKRKSKRVSRRKSKRVSRRKSKRVSRRKGRKSRKVSKRRGRKSNKRVSRRKGRKSGKRRYGGMNANGNINMGSMFL
jgi:hypothetical protein